MSTTGWRSGTSSVSQPISPSARTTSPARSAARPEPSSTRQRTDGSIAGEVAVQELLRVVRLRGDVHALAQLEHGFEHRRVLRPPADDREALVVGDGESRLGERTLDPGRETGDVLPEQRPAGRDGARVAHRVAVALLDLGRRDDDVIDDARDRTLLGAR